MNGRNGPLSPVSVSGSDWNYPDYPSNDKQGPPRPGPGPYPSNRGQLPFSPPNSGGSVGPMDGGFSPLPRSAGGPSPPASIGRSSTASNLYARSESGRSVRDDNHEAVLGEHYISLKRFLSEKTRDGRPLAPPNKARDKLQRLTGVQFLELSTDVYDELKRREAIARRPPNAPNGPPPYLMPENNFHPKRNQARQKLSSLGPPRFRDLATDVFCELERRYPRFQAGDIPRIGSPMSTMSMRGPPSRTGTPVNGSMNGFPPRGQSRVRRPSEASSVRSGRGAPGQMSGNYGVPPSPAPTNGEFGRPLPKQFQSNTIVPNKSTMLEEDDEEPLSPLTPAPPTPVTDAYGLGVIPSGAMGSEASFLDSTRSAVTSDTDKKIIDDYEAQVKDLREKIDSMEDDMKKKDDEMNELLDGERSRASAADVEKKGWDDVRADLETRLTEAQNLNESLQQELDRLRQDHDSEIQDIRDQLEDARNEAQQARQEADEDRQDAQQARQEAQEAKQNQQPSSRDMGSNGGAFDGELQQENYDLRLALEEQRQVTEDVRQEAQESLREMRLLSQQSSTAYDKHDELEQTIEQLEKEVRDWRNRYARTKTQLRNMRAASLGLDIEQDAARYVREKGFMEEGGMVKDVHVTKFQIAIDELLRTARVDDPDKVIASMKAVVVSVRRITKDIDESAHEDEERMQQQARLRSRVSKTANNLITASKNFAGAAGISPVSLLDAAASHLVTAVVDMLRTVKIRATPAGELEDDDDGTVTPVDSTGFFSPRTNSHSQSSSVLSSTIQSSAIQTSQTTQDSVPHPPPFQGLGGIRGSIDSSTYSPIDSPRESYASRRPVSGGGATNGIYAGVSKPAPLTNGFKRQAAPTNPAGDARAYLEDQTDVLVQTIQKLVELIRDEHAHIDTITAEIESISDIIGKFVSEADSLEAGMTDRLRVCRDRILEAGDQGMDLAADGKDGETREWRMWTQTLPPIAFEIAREAKEIVTRVGGFGDSEFA